ncbi:hypothetical protein M405DRAFT_162336 [Rhizopogon salebrosus TDB-379]|nr:hypothetical protein M405DRAFT_162336 [Rhizopogon salebrosus TDB-379]
MKAISFFHPPHLERRRLFPPLHSTIFQSSVRSFIGLQHVWRPGMLQLSRLCVVFSVLSVPQLLSKFLVEGNAI